MTQYETAREFARMLLDLERSSGAATTNKSIRNAVSEAATNSRVGGLTPVEIEKLIRELETFHQHTIGRASTLIGEDDDWAPWIRSRGGQINWLFWERYRRHLGKEGFNDTVLGSIGNVTEEVLGLLGDPAREGRWDRRGLAVGLVQSGKTANYIGVINKAIDAGYKLIVVITGFTESLRVQTQIRVDNGALGYWLRRDPDNPSNLQRIDTGVGKIQTFSGAQQVDTVTTRRDDFKRAIVRNLGIHIGGNPLVLVVKKNATVLEHLLNWARNFGGAKTDGDGAPYVPDIPLLVIDDESDVGSVDTAAGAIDSVGDPDPDHNPSTINRQIRKLLTLFDQSSYIGYTATPFANVLIHDQVEADLDRGLRIGKDLFPVSFIVSLPSPTNHIGPSVVFGSDGEESEVSDELPVLRVITDSEIGEDPIDYWMPGSHKKDHVPRYEDRDEMPPSLKEAILSFIIVCTARMLRGDGDAHNSMLVHVTRYVDVQDRVLSQINTYLQDTVSRLRNSTADKDLRVELKRLWQEDFIPTTKKICSREGLLFQNPVHSWADIERALVQAATSIESRTINGQSKEVLDYEVHKNGLNIIAIGGDKLARGLTLEGLSVSYFLRSTRMYDTLMQMGRWFGYREGYLDLCRLYTTDQMQDWFRHISDATRELRYEFESMNLLGLTPREFGLRVRSHPTMMVTSKVKSRHAQDIQVSFHGSMEQTLSFSRKAKVIENNWSAAERLVRFMDDDPDTIFNNDDLTWMRVKPEAVITFLTEYENFHNATTFNSRQLKEYIEAEFLENRLTRWVVKISSIRASRQPWSLGLHSGNCLSRGWKGKKDELIKDYHYKTGALTDPRDEAAGLGDTKKSEADAAHDRFRKKLPEADKRKTRATSGRFYRMYRDKEEGALILYPLDPGDGKAETVEYPILGACISFPRVDEDQASKVRYTVNPVYLREDYG